jgi:hypothetical protein
MAKAGSRAKGTSTGAIATSSAPSANRRHMRGGSLCANGISLDMPRLFALEKAITRLGACRPDRTLSSSRSRGVHIADPECNCRIGAGVVIACAGGCRNIGAVCRV